MTGASRGIGEGAARAFARTGASVVLVARNESGLVAVETRILNEVPKAQVLKIALDVIDPTEVEAAVARVVEIFGGVDMLVAAAGTMRTADAGGSRILKRSYMQAYSDPINESHLADGSR